MKSLQIPALVVSTILFSGCSDQGVQVESELNKSDTPTVHSVNYPLHYFAERIGGGLIDLQFLVPADGDPAFWEPSDEQALAMQSGDVVFLNGATYEKWLAHVTLPPSILYDTSRAFSDRYIKANEAGAHAHGNGEAHAHGGIAFTTWLDMTQAIEQATAVRDVLIRKLPKAEVQLKENAEALFKDLEVLDVELESIGKSIGERPLLASHPVYQYFARRYGLNIESVHWEPETVPDDDGIAELKKKLAAHPAKWMIWEGEPADESVAKLKALGVGSVVFDPCGNRPEQGDWLSVMRQNVERLREVSGQK